MKALLRRTDADVCEPFYDLENERDKFPPTRHSWQDETRNGYKNRRVVSMDRVGCTQGVATYITNDALLAFYVSPGN